jgi:hypothetical protein
MIALPFDYSKSVYVHMRLLRVVRKMLRFELFAFDTLQTWSLREKQF